MDLGTILAFVAGGGIIKLLDVVFIPGRLRKQDLANDKAAREEIGQLYELLSGNRVSITELHEALRAANERINLMERALFAKELEIDKLRAEIKDLKNGKAA